MNTDGRLPGGRGGEAEGGSQQEGEAELQVLGGLHGSGGGEQDESPGSLAGPVALLHRGN